MLWTAFFFLLAFLFFSFFQDGSVKRVEGQRWRRDGR